jgi:hypothetical protein
MEFWFGGFDEVENCPGMVSKGNQTRAGFTKRILAGLKTLFLTTGDFDFV